MKIKTPSDNLILLPMEVLPRVKNASATELKVLLYLFGKKEATPAEMAQQLGQDLHDITDVGNILIADYPLTSLFVRGIACLSLPATLGHSL